MDGEEPADFQELHNDIINQFNPLPGAEDLLVFIATACLWRLRRILQLEAAFATAGSAGACRDPRVDALVEDKNCPRKIQESYCENFFILPSLAHQTVKPATKRAHAINSNDDEAERRLRDEFEKLLPQQSNQLSQNDSLEMLVKISSYKSSVRRTLARVINILVGLQNKQASASKKSRGAPQKRD